MSSSEENVGITLDEIIQNPERWHDSLLGVQNQREDVKVAELVLNFREKYLIKDLEDWLECWKKQRDDYAWVPTVPPIDDMIQAAETLLVFFNTSFEEAVDQVTEGKQH